jgi:hypothetical protein
MLPRYASTEMFHLLHAQGAPCHLDPVPDLELRGG